MGVSATVGETYKVDVGKIVGVLVLTISTGVKVNSGSAGENVLLLCKTSFEGDSYLPNIFEVVRIQ